MCKWKVEVSICSVMSKDYSDPTHQDVSKYGIHHWWSLGELRFNYTSEEVPAQEIISAKKFACLYLKLNEQASLIPFRLKLPMNEDADNLSWMHINIWSDRGMSQTRWKGRNKNNTWKYTERNLFLPFYEKRTTLYLLSSWSGVAVLLHIPLITERCQQSILNSWKAARLKFIARFCKILMNVTMKNRMGFSYQLNYYLVTTFCFGWELKTGNIDIFNIWRHVANVPNLNGSRKRDFNVFTPPWDIYLHSFRVEL